MKRMSDQISTDGANSGGSSLPPSEKVTKEDGVENTLSDNQPNEDTKHNEGDHQRSAADRENGTPSSPNPETVDVKSSKAAMKCDSESPKGNEAGVSVSCLGETVSFNLVFGKTKFDMTEPLDESVTEFKESVAKLTGVPPAMQKLMFKGMLKDCQTLRDAKITAGCKIMLIGSTPTQIAAANTAPKPEELLQAEAQAAAKVPLCKQKQHSKVLEKAMPEDIMPGIKNVRERLPLHPISGMINKMGNKVRLTFKLELDQVWLGTKERTEKIMMSQIKDVVSEPIEGHEEYHIMGLQLGPTEASLYWLYWVPAQFVAAIKEAILG